MKQVRTLSFAGQNIYCGIDVHKKGWSVCIRDESFELKTFSQPPDPVVLADFLRRNYPQANYHAVYEAGFSGYWAQRDLSRQGVNCLITHAADVPTSDKDRQQKTDKADCRKLALSLSNKQVEGIYIPSEDKGDCRSMFAASQQLVNNQTPYTDRIPSSLTCCGLSTPA